MSSLRKAVEDYLEMHRNLGYKLRMPTCLLRHFAAFAEARGAEYVTTALALQWAQRPPEVLPATQAWRLSFVRRFARWHAAIDSRTEVPPESLLPHQYRRKPPYIYSDDEIERLVRVAAALPSSLGLRRWTYSTLFGLLAATGMRSGEAVNLDRNDVDLYHGVLFIRRTKFGKSRLIPLHPSTVEALAAYADKRDALIRSTTTPAFFLSEKMRRITRRSADRTFAHVSAQIGLRPTEVGRSQGHGPRLHDMRHRFAVMTLLDFYRKGLDVERELPKLSTYLGHVHVDATYWYLEAVPELLQLATDRLCAADKEGE